MSREQLKIGDKKSFANLAELQVFAEEYHPKDGEFKVAFSKAGRFIAKKVTVAALLFASYVGTAQVCSSKDTEEKFTIAAFVDPKASIDEGGVNYGLEAGFLAHGWYAKAQIESFEVLTGGYFSWGAAVGTHLQANKFRFLLGARSIITYRNGGMRPMYGVEGLITYDVSERWYVGVRATYDHRKDMELLDYPVIWRESGFLTVGYKLDLF